MIAATGSPVVAIVKLPSEEVEKEVEAALVKAGAAPGLVTVRVKLWVAGEPIPLEALRAKV